VCPKIIAALAAWVALAAPTGAAPAGAVPAGAAPTPDPGVIDADNAFGLKLLKVLRAEGAENVAISPTSVAMAMQVVLDGAKGPTRQAMAAALQLNGPAAENVDAANQALQKSLAGTGPQIQLTIANSLWLRHGGREVVPSFMQAARDYYAAEIGDLAGAPDNVNAWISQKPME
jgi:serine protease inhibitor